MPGSRCSTRSLYEESMNTVRISRRVHASFPRIRAGLLVKLENGSPRLTRPRDDGRVGHVPGASGRHFVTGDVRTHAALACSRRSALGYNKLEMSWSSPYRNNVTGFSSHVW